MTDSNRLTTDRRTVMKASAAAVGARAFGLTAGAITANDDDNHFVVASDFHLGSPWANADDSYKFLTEEVPDLNPDVLVLAGDIYELWWRGLLSCALDFSAHSHAMEQLHADGTEVVLVPGNHDRWLLRPGKNTREELMPDPPWRIGEEYFFESGGTEFVAVHGDIVDPGNPVQRSMWLSKQTDEFGSVLLTFYEDWQDTEAPSTSETGSQSLAETADWQSVGLERRYDNPVVIATPVATAAGVSPALRVLGGPTDAFDARLVSEDGEPRSGTIEYLVVEDGTHYFGDETQMSSTAVDAGDRWTHITFEQSFDEVPVVLAAVQDGDDAPPEATHPVEEPQPPWSRISGSRQGIGSRQGTNSPGSGSVGDGVGYLPKRESSENSPPELVAVRNVTREGFDVRVDGGSGERRVGYVATDRGWDGVGDGIMHATVTESEENERVASSRIDDPDHVITMTQSTTDEGQSVATLSFETGGTFETTSYEQLSRHWGQVVETEMELAGDPPEEPPVIAGFEPLFQTQSIASNLLEAYDEFIVFGHTHRPELSTRHANAGSWTTRGNPPKINTYLEIIDGQVSGWDWSPDGRTLLFEQ